MHTRALLCILLSSYSMHSMDTNGRTPCLIKILIQRTTLKLLLLLGVVLLASSRRAYYAYQLREGSQYRGAPGARALEEIAFRLYGELIPEPQNSLRGAGKVDAIATEVLWHSDDPRLQGALWWRLSLPLMVPTIAVIALALSRTDARRGRYAKVGPAMVVLLLYFLGLTQGRGAVESSDGPALIIAVHVGFALLALLLLHWERVSKCWRVVRRV